MKFRIVIIIFFLFAPLVLMANDLFKNAQKFLSDTSKFAIKRIIQDTIWTGSSKNYETIMQNILSVIGKVNSQNQTQFVVTNSNSTVIAYEKSLGMWGKMISFKKDSSLVFYAQGVCAVANGSIVPGAAFLFIKYKQIGNQIHHRISFYLRPKSGVLNLLIGATNIIDEKAYQIFEVALNTLKIISQEGFD